MKVAIRADAYADIGTGHVMRCIALAQGIRESGGEVVFVTFCDSNGLVNRLDREGFELHLVGLPGSLAESLSVFERAAPDWVVLDGYHFDTAYQWAVKETGYKLCVIDDYAHLDHYHADIILNQNFGAEKFNYHAEPDTRFLLGTEYAMLRKEFLQYRGFERNIPAVAEKLLVTLGGADPGNKTLKVLNAADLIQAPLTIRVVVGAANPHYETLATEAAGSGHTVEILKAVENMAPLMAWADAAVSAGGSTVWELIFMRLPALLCIVADNQERSVEALSTAGIFASAGYVGDIAQEELALMLAKLVNDKKYRANQHAGHEGIVDGHGAERVADVLRSQNPIADSLRRDFDLGDVRFINFANLSDSQSDMILDWRNSREIRRWMFTDHTITRAEHADFIASLRHDDRNVYWLVYIDGLPTGSVYLQQIDAEGRKGRSGYLGIYTVRKGCARKMLDCLMTLWFENAKMQTLRCELFEDNHAALKLYEDAGFRITDTGEERHVVRDGSSHRIIMMEKHLKDHKESVHEVPR